MLMQSFKFLENARFNNEEVDKIYATSKKQIKTMEDNKTIDK